MHDAVVNDDSMQVGGGRLVDRKLLEEGFGECSPYEFCCSVGSACYCEGLKRTLRLWTGLAWTGLDPCAHQHLIQATINQMLLKLFCPFIIVVTGKLV